MTPYTWLNPYILVQLLGLSPLFAMSNSLLKAALLGGANLLLLCTAAGAARATVRWQPQGLIINATIAASLTVCLSLALAAANLQLQQQLALAAPLLLGNAVLLAYLAGRLPDGPRVFNLTYAARLGAKMLLLLLIVGCARQSWGLTNPDWPLAQPAFMAFFLVGGLLAIKNCLRHGAWTNPPNTPLATTHQPAIGSKRIRTTGEIR